MTTNDNNQPNVGSKDARPTAVNIDPRDIKPWYPTFLNTVATGERRPGRYTKKEKKRIWETTIPVHFDRDVYKDYLPGGKHYVTPEEREAEIQRMMEEERAAKEYHEKERAALVAAMTTSSSSMSYDAQGTSGGTSGGTAAMRGGRGRGGWRR